MPPKERKIAMMGYRSVGKSSLAIQFVENQFVDSYDPTIENIFGKVIRVNGQDFDVKVIDTAGQDERSIFPSQYGMGIHAYVLVYSITSSKSFEVIQVIYDKLIDMLGGQKRVPIVLLGNKTDLHYDRVIAMEEGKKLAEMWNAAFLETSAKTNEANLGGVVVPETKKSITDVFVKTLDEIEKSEGNGKKSDGSGCVIS